MAKIAGTYELVKNENFVEYLVAAGIPEDKAKKADALKPKLKVAVDGNKITLDSDSGVVKTSATFILNQEVEEKTLDNVVLKSTAKLEGNTLSVTSKTANGKIGFRVHYFSDTELVISLTTDDADGPVATRSYKRI